MNAVEPLLLVDRCPRVVFTGSYAYGRPTEESDVDVVVQVTEDELVSIRADLMTRGVTFTSARFDTFDGYKSPALEESFRIGKINFILVTNDAQFAVWEQGTAECRKRAAAAVCGFIPRDEAVAVFQRLEQELLT